MSHGSAIPSPAPSGDGKTLPKNRGCFQCSRRRIICDRGEPTCQKCTKKGIECSGLGRIRFAEGVARRGQLKGLKVPVRKNDPAKETLPANVGYGQVRWKNEQKKTTRKKRRRKSENDEFDIGWPADSPSILSNEDREVFASPTASGDFKGDEDDDVVEIVRDDTQMLLSRSVASSIQPWIAPLGSEARMLFSHCKMADLSLTHLAHSKPVSDAVAPVMVVFDTVPNGYREFILPMAVENDVLRRAVGVVAAQHLSREQPELADAAEAGRSAIISRLRRESLYSPADQVFNAYTWATLIVLLVGETVTGSADYSFLVHMLLCLSTNITANHEKTDALEFLEAQTNIYFGIPQLGEDRGVLTVMESYQSMTSWLTPTYEQLPTGSEEVDIMRNLRRCFTLASEIYIHRATTELNDDPTPSPIGDSSQHSAIQDLITLISQIPPTAPGAHTLIWACFVAAAETSDPQQRQFFVDYMLAIYERTKFRNIPLGVQSLERIWSRKGNQRWTQCLSELSKVLVM
ncbi:similar to C6 zinc finger domain containing protein [Plenodomus lingam JN3]|uniref:Similar to C6 zinc finger domain containing protein n=1 Tax=Leptosphaeria maculans (strain JN3 / isolate v23.1.3 / race Av1-4-5-6-7-8) TaxID=985895 RepID=E5ABJ0_LEPMJ|nr:similar to C6 zinc finger domain containing protein [Plenodomus lingam JN3]CBY01031.1 similar to C6 zinc finger domain containing protein [Plenodomus lingam JN3]